MLLADPEEARRSAGVLSAQACWADAFAAAKLWKITAPFAEAIQSFDAQPPAAEWQDFRRARIEAYAQSVSRAAKGSAALRRLHDSGIPAIAFKGLASMARFYPQPGRRFIGDADLLVAKQNLQSAVESLAGAGFRPLENHRIELLDRMIDHLPAFAGNKAIVLYGPGDSEVDLHWSVGVPGLEPTALIARGETAMLFQHELRIVGVEDGLILTVRHAIRENLTVDMICRDLLDVRQSWEWLAARGRLEAACARMVECKSLVATLAMTGILGSLDRRNEALAKAGARLSELATAADQQAAKRLHELFFQQVKDGPVRKDLLYLAHARPGKQMLTAAWSNWREYRGVMRSIEEATDGSELPLPRRLRLLAGAALRTGPAQFRSIRTLARLKYGE